MFFSFNMYLNFLLIKQAETIVNTKTAPITLPAEAMNALFCSGVSCVISGSSTLTTQSRNSYMDAIKTNVLVLLPVLSQAL